MEEQVDIINEHDEVIGSVPRSQMRRERLPHRASYIVVQNREGRYLIEVRTLNKDYAPGLLDACVGGVVQSGEDPLLSARRELAEEIGVSVDDPKMEFKFLGTMRIDYPKHHPRSFLFAYLFIAKGDAITVRQREEVSGIMYLTATDVVRLEHNFTTDSVTAFNEIIRRVDAADKAGPQEA